VLQVADSNKPHPSYLQPVSFTDRQYAAKAASVQARLGAEANFWAMVDSDREFWDSPDDS